MWTPETPQPLRREPALANTRTITFITVNYHCSALLAELIESINKQGDQHLHCLVVDNSPHDPGLEPLSQLQSVTILRADHNLGFGGGCNLALQALNNKDPQAIAWLINPDASLLPGAVATVRRCLAQVKAPAVLGTRILDSTSKIWFDHGRFDPTWGRLNHEPPPDALIPSSHHSTSIQQCDWVSGCSMVLNLGAMGPSARFDERFFLYYEDAEFCIRLKSQGATVAVTQEALVEHRVSSITSRAPASKYQHATFSKLYLLYKHACKRAVLLNLLRFYSRLPILALRDPAQAMGRALGATHFILWMLNSTSRP